MKLQKEKKKGAQLSKQQLRTQIDLPENIHNIKVVKNEIQHLRKILRAWNLSKNGNYFPVNDSRLIKDYVTAQCQYYEEDQFNQHFVLLENFQANLFLIEDQGLILKSFKLFPRTIWPIRYHNKFVSRLMSYSNPEEIYYIMSHIYRLSCGTVSTYNSIGGARPINFKRITLNRFFTVRLLREKNLFVHIGVEKIPILKNGIIKRYEFIQYMHFLDILADQFIENKNKCDEKMNFFTELIYNDAAKKDHSEELEIDRQKFGKFHHHQPKDYFFNEVLNEYTGKYEYYESALPDKSTAQAKGSNTYYPIIFKPYYVSVGQNSTVVYDEKMKRWLSKDHLTVLQRKKLLAYQKQISDVMVKRFVDFQSAKTLVELLTKIPNFKVNLTEQEKSVIGENGNVLAIGRSGTGKTTCAVLRLFSIEMLFKIRLSLYKKKFQDTLQGVRCDSDDINTANGLHCIFLTASPVLTHEIQRYYKKLTDNIKTQLEKKKKKVEAQKKQERQEQMKQKQRQVLIKEINQEQEMKQISSKQEEILDAPQKLEPKKSAEDLEQQKQINQEFEGLQLKEDIKNEQFKQEQEDVDQLKNKFEQNVNKFRSLFDLNESDYPGFFTVKSFIMMIDGVLTKPFFIRSKNTIVGQESKSSWHNERKGVMMIENYYRGEEDKQAVNIDQIQQEFNYSDQEQLQHEYLRQIQLRENRDKQQLTKKLQKQKIASCFSFEVDYQYFVVHFWPRVVKKYYSSRNITPHLVWTEIYSTIKGSSQSHHYPGQYLNQNSYMNATANTFLTREEKLDIYETFCQYERWKIRAGGYDLLDSVNYILNYIRYRGYQGPEIHYVMIDEVQDLPHAIVYLLSKTATYGVFYSGDTAQTIAKGVGFRFCDLKALFKNLGLREPITKHLTVNFRSHNNILQLANSVVSSLEILFPKTIDRLMKEVSDLNGPKPMILSSNDEQLLFYVLCGGEQQKIEGNGMKKPPLEFGCDQVIIVRDQQSKAKIPAMLQHALCLTIYEAKGLQFNDVILFNFFEQSPCPEKWSLLKSLNVITAEIPKDEYEKNLSRHQQNKQVNKESKSGTKQEKQQEDKQEEVNVEQHFNKQKNVYQVKKITSSITKQFKDINDYAELCSELKLLYTAITRPKKTLIIYDDGEAVSRLPIQRLWQRLNAIEIITKQVVLANLNKKSSLSEEVKIFKTIAIATDKSQWKQQGLKMYARGYFDQAMKCFDRSGHVELYKKAEANKYADEATRKLIQIQSERNSIKQGSAAIKEMSSNELARLKKKLKVDQIASLKKFLNAGNIFQELLMFKQAGQCYFSGKLFEKAFECFCKAFMNKQAAESLQMQNKYREAAEYYQKEDNYLKVIQCLDMVNEWVLILQKIQRFATKMSEYEKQALLKKYSALALEQLVYEIEFENEEQANKPQNNRVEVIQEKDSDEQQEFYSDDDPQLAAERQYERKMSQQQSNPSRKQSEVSQQQKGLIDIKQSVYEQLGEQGSNDKSQIKQEKKEEQASMSFSALNSSDPQASRPQQSKVKDEQQGIKSVDQSFGDLNKSQQPIVLQGVKQQQKIDLESIESSFGDINAKYENYLQPDLQSIKSMVDPEDLWVKNSISQITHKLHSEYSVLDNQEENYNINVKIIKTKGNIFVQDQIMRKIVNIVSIINTSVHQFFKQFKGYQSLITVNEGDSNQVMDQRPQISEFEDIDPKFINIILDMLQSFKLFKLCLFVCNRYHLPAKAGRYLISLGMKYSTNCISNNVVNPILLAPSAYRKIQIEKGILASIAIHAIYQNVNSQFLKIKVSDKEEENKYSLGSYFIEGLILEGLYKKAVFMVDPLESLKILANFNDFNAYSNIYRQKILKQNNENICTFLENPKRPQQLQFTKVLLRKAIFEYCVVHKFETISQRYYKQFQPQGEIGPSRLAVFNIPNYLPFTQALINKSQQFISKFKQLIVSGYRILAKGTSLQVLDFVSTLLAVIHNEQMQNQITQTFQNNSFLQLYRCVNYIRQVLRKINGRNALSIIEAVLNMHQCYRISYCKSMTFVNDTFSFVNRTSTVANELVQNQKTNTGSFAYFFQQDYNFILTKTSRVIKTVSKKYQNALLRLYIKKIKLTYYHSQILHEGWVNTEQQMVIKKALTYDIECLGDPKKKKKKSVDKNKKTKDLKANYDFRCRNRELMINLQQSSDSEEEVYEDKQLKFYRYNSNPRLKYLAHSMIHWFTEQSSRAKEIVEGRYLYCSNLSSSYREYIQTEGGFNLFDALEFQRFKRIDLFAENILSVYNKLTLYTKHNLLAEILTLLLIQYKSLEEPKGFSLSVPTDYLKYFEQLKAVKLKANQSQSIIHLNTDEILYLLSKNNQIKFEYNNEYVSEMTRQDLSGIICDYLQILQDEEGSQYVNLPKIILMYAVNIGKNDQINQCIRKIIKMFGSAWKNQSLHYLTQSKNLAEYENKRKAWLTSPVKQIHQVIHDIAISNKGNLTNAIRQSEFDYEVEGMILRGRKKAVNKIIKWWKGKRIQLKTRRGLALNYLELSVEPSNLEQAKRSTILGDIRLITLIHQYKALGDIDLLVKTQKAKTELLSFYLTNTVTSSLDFHFILMNLNKIEECRKHYFQYCKEDVNELHQFDIDQIHTQMGNLLSTIQVWKNDQKWLREKNFNLKRKKVFQVKWMTKNLGFGNMLKKRAGLKKQALLQQKRKMIKRIK